MRSTSLFSILVNTFKGTKKSSEPQPKSINELEFWKMDLIESRDKTRFKMATINAKLNEENMFILGARKLKQDGNIEEEILQAQGKIACLNRALLKYRALLVLDQESDMGREYKVEALGYSGRIKLKLLSCLDVIGKSSANTEISLLIKVDGIKKAQSRFTRDTWNEEIVFDVDNGIELEFLILGNNGSVLAMIWFTFRMLVDDMKFFYNYSGILVKPAEQTNKWLSTPAGILSKGDDKLECVFELEPAGRLHMIVGLGQCSLYLLIRIRSIISKKGCIYFIDDLEDSINIQEAPCTETIKETRP